MKKLNLFYLILLFNSHNLICENEISRNQLDLFDAIQKKDTKKVKIVLQKGANILSTDVLNPKSALEVILESIETQEKTKLLRYSILAVNGVNFLISSIIAYFFLFEDHNGPAGDGTVGKFCYKGIPISGSITALNTFISYKSIKQVKNTEEIFNIFLTKLKEIEAIPTVLLDYYKSHTLPKKIKEEILKFIEEKNKKEGA